MFDLAHLQRIHHALFKDIYAWAGQLRTVEIGKGILGSPTPTRSIRLASNSSLDFIRKACWEAYPAASTLSALPTTHYRQSETCLNSY